MKRPTPPAGHADPLAEQHAIGALVDADGMVLRSDAGTLLGTSGLSAEDFTRADLRAYAGAIRALAERRRPADPVTVAATVRGTPGAPEDAYAALAVLRGANELNREGFAAVAERLRRLTALRKLHAFHAAQLDALAAPDADPVALGGAVDGFARDFTASVEPDETAQSDIYEVTEAWDAFMRDERAPFVRTGIAVLDENFKGFVGNLNVIGGHPSIGKTALADTLVMNFLRAGLKVALVGLEDGTTHLTERHLALAVGIAHHDVAAIRLNQFQADSCQEALQKFHGLFANLRVHRRAGATAEMIVQKFKRWRSLYGTEVFVIDHTGEIQHKSQAARERHDLAVANTLATLRDFAWNNKVPVLSLQHFNRDTPMGQKPSMDSFAEAAATERMARTALGLWTVKGKAHELRVTVLKATKSQKDQTVVLNRHMEQGLIKNAGGYLLDEDEERRQEQDAAQATRRASIPTVPRKTGFRPMPNGVGP